MSMPNFEPRVSRSGLPSCTPSTLPVPSISGCMAGSVSSAKIFSAGASMTVLADSWFLGMPPTVGRAAQRGSARVRACRRLTGQPEDQLGLPLRRIGLLGRIDRVDLQPAPPPLTVRGVLLVPGHPLAPGPVQQITDGGHEAVERAGVGGGDVAAAGQHPRVHPALGRYRYRHGRPRL